MPAEPLLTGAAAAWVERCTGSPVVGGSSLSGGYSSRMLGLRLADGREVVLRQLVLDPWRRHAVGLLEREAEVQQLLAGVLPVPVPLGLDADGTATGEPSLLMTRLEGAIDLVRCDRGHLEELARTLAAVHRVRPPEGQWPREYQSWAFESKRVVPPWSTDDGLYREAFDRLAGAAPPYEPTFLHRDFSPGNVLLHGGRVTGVVDWVETSTGPADLDVAHCVSNLATLHGAEVAVAFEKEYVAAGGGLEDDRDASTYWKLLDLVAYLPVGGRESGAAPTTMTATWAAYGRGDLTPDLARCNRQDLLRAILRG